MREPVAWRPTFRSPVRLLRDRHNHDVMVMVVVVVAMMVAMPPAPVMVVMMMMMMGSCDDDLRELERLASLFLLRPKRVDRVRNGIQQFREGLRRPDARIGRGGRGGEGAAAADESERRSAAKKSKHRFVHGVSFLDRKKAKRGETGFVPSATVAEERVGEDSLPGRRSLALDVV